MSANTVNSTAGIEIHEVPSGAATRERMQRWKNCGKKQRSIRSWKFSTHTTTCGIAVATTLARARPELSIVVDHCGGVLGIGPYAGRRSEVFAPWRQSIRALQPLGNVSVKFGGLAMALAGFAWRAQPVPPHSEELARAWQPHFDVCLDTFGPDRCMFESNFPVDRIGCTYTSLWNAFKRLAAVLSPEEREALCVGTAKRVYRL